MERELLVYVDRAKAPVLAGRLWARVRAAKESASFEYDASWLDRRDAFALDPELPLARGAFHTGRSLFNAFTDTAPDRWGQTLMRRNELARARREKRQPRTLFTVDFTSRTPRSRTRMKRCPVDSIPDAAHEPRVADGLVAFFPSRCGLDSHQNHACVSRTITAGRPSPHRRGPWRGGHDGLPMGCARRLALHGHEGGAS